MSKVKIAFVAGLSYLPVLVALGVMLSGCTSKKNASQQAISLWWHGLLHKR